MLRLLECSSLNLLQGVSAYEGFSACSGLHRSHAAVKLRHLYLGCYFALLLNKIRCKCGMQVKYLQQLKHLLKTDINVELARVHRKDTMGLTVQTLSFTFSSSPGKSAEELLSKAADVIRERLANLQKLATQSDVHNSAVHRSIGASSFGVTLSIPELIIPIKV